MCICFIPYILGDELSEKTLKYFRPYALPGDIVTQFIPKSLGGKDRCDNAFNNIHSSVSELIKRK